MNEDDRIIQKEKCRLLTRREIIDIWQKQSKEFLNTYCCKNCRDLLYETKKENEWYCKNCDIYFISEVK